MTCDDDHAAAHIATATTLAGWSVGRLGPIYALARATPAQLQQVNYIMLVNDCF